MATHTTIHVNGVTAGGRRCCAIALARGLLTAELLLQLLQLLISIRLSTMSWPRTTTQMLKLRCHAVLLLLLLLLLPMGDTADAIAAETISIQPRVGLKFNEALVVAVDAAFVNNHPSRQLRSKLQRQDVIVQLYMLSYMCFHRRNETETSQLQHL
jgi:hypothetical protein